MIDRGSWRRGSIGAKYSRKPPPPAQFQLTILAYHFPRVKRQGVHSSGFGRTHGRWNVRLSGHAPPAARGILCAPQGTFWGCKSRGVCHRRGVGSWPGLYLNNESMTHSAVSASWTGTAGKDTPLLAGPDANGTVKPNLWGSQSNLASLCR